MPDLRICYTKLILSFIAPAVLLRGIVSVDPCLLQREERAAGTTSQSERSPSPSTPMQSWLGSIEESDFPLENIPFGVCELLPPSPSGGLVAAAAGEEQTRTGGECRCCTRIGDHVIDLSALCALGVGCFAREEYKTAFAVGQRLNIFMSLGRKYWREVRAEVQSLFALGDEDRAEDDEARLQLGREAVLSIESVRMLVPAYVGDYSDFYASREHATNVGKMFRGAANALQPNWLHLPVGYHGRASSVVTSGTPIRRPRGQLAAAEPGGLPRYTECAALDFELEMGVFIGLGSTLGEPVDVRHARDHIFGLVLLNDWSARDVQRWEYVPLGPFNAKNFGTSISPWIVTLEALEPFTRAAELQEPAVLPYLQQENARAYDVDLQVAVNGSVVCRSNLQNVYWSLEQLVAHHTSTGCNLNPGDLMGTGTISGPGEGALGSLLELSWNNSRDVALSATGETRRYLKDGDSVVLSGSAGGSGAGRIGFGVCEGTILPSHSEV